MVKKFSILMVTLICSCFFIGIAAAQTNVQTKVQPNEVAQISTDTPLRKVLKDEDRTGEKEKDSSATMVEMNERIHQQQLEIDELRDHVKKLESMLESAVNRSVEPAANRGAYPATVAPPSPPPAVALAKRTPNELLPDLGHIGAEVGILVGGSQNPFKANEGFFAGGFIDLPLKKVKGGKISYEIMIGAQRTVTNVQTTSGVIALVNGALNTALGNPPSPDNLLGPLPVTNRIKERLTVLTVVPASLKYTLMSLDRQSIRPYVVVGLGTYVGLSSQQTVDFDAAKYINNPALASLINALLSGPQIGGLIPIAPELRSRGLSQGQGDFRFGLNAGGGIEFRVTPRFSLGFDYRINKMEGRNSTFSTFTAKPTFHF